MAGFLSLSLTNERHEIARAASAIEAFGREHALSADDISAVNLALDEILANIISHAYVDDARHLIHMRLTLDDGAIQVVVEIGRAHV